MTAVELPEVGGRAVYVSGTGFDERRVGAAAVYCSDGRFGDPMDEFLHAGLGLPRYDRVAVPGGAYHEGRALARQLDFLIREHGLRRVVLIAHDGCAFYKDVWTGGRPVERQQAADLAKAAAHIRLWHPRVTVEAYFARKRDRRVAFEPWETGDVGDSSNSAGLLRGVPG